MPGTRFFTEKDAAACIVLCFTMARMVQRRESRKLCRMIAGCWTGRDRSLAGWRRCGTGLQTGKGRGIVAHMALFFSNVRPDSCKEFFLSFSRLTLGKASGLPENSLRLVTAKESLHRSECGSGCGSVCEAWGRGKRAVCAGVQRREAERGSRGRVVWQSGQPGLPGLSWPERQSAGQFGRRQARAPDWREDLGGLLDLPERTERGAV